VTRDRLSQNEISISDSGSLKYINGFVPALKNYAVIGDPE
jgi:hypothetical protein